MKNKEIFAIKMVVITLIILVMITLFKWSAVKSRFKAELQTHFINIDREPAVLNEGDIAFFPDPVQRYFDYCGLLGKPKKMNAEVVWADSYIRLQPDKSWTKLRTIQYNTVEKPFRIAYMKAHMFGFIPFEGRDIYHNGSGSMFGKVANLITVFDVKDKEIGQSALIIILAEALLIPGYALQDYITWEAVDSHTAKAVIQHKGIEAGGTFHFNDEGAMIKFESNERYYRTHDGKNIKVPFTALVGDYKQQGDIRIPTSLKAIWHLPEGDYEYWKGTIEEVRYNIVLN